MLQIREKVEALAEVESELRASESELKELLSTMTTEDASRENEELRVANAKSSRRLKELKSSVTLVSSEERELVKRGHSASLVEYKARKRLCIGILDAILEEYPKSKASLFEEVGIETDQEAQMPVLKF